LTQDLELSGRGPPPTENRKRKNPDGMRVIVIGAGDVGRHIAETLSGERHDVTVVDMDAQRVDAMQRDLDALVITGNGASPKFLQEIGAKDADLLCAVTQSDEANVIAALAAHQLGAARTVARVRDDDYFEPGESFARDLLGIDFVIHPERATADDLAESILLPGAVHVEYFADGRVGVAECILSMRSPLIGNPLRDRRMVRPHEVVALLREGRAVPADLGHKPKVADHILIAAAREDLGPVITYVAGHAAKVSDVVVFGAGRVGLPLARRLEAADGLRVTVMERDAERARYVAELLPRTTVLHEEGLAKEAMLAQGVDRVGAFAACTGDDRANLLAALHAKQLGADLCLAVVSREEYMPLVDALAIDAAFSPRLVTAEAILRSVRGENVHAMHLLWGGAEILEVSVEPGCPSDGRPLAATGSLARTRPVAVVRDGRVLMPDGQLLVQGGDRVLVFNTRQGVSDVRRAFSAA
jgi:trk system potassium uptake protein TrkA